MAFPQLLRRSSFVQHDPLITRIYTSTPSSIYQSGDWGLKYPIHRPKGPKCIKVSNLDAGSAIGSDWRSGEKEARFMETWGSGKIPWSSRGNDITRGMIRKQSIYDSDEPVETASEQSLHRALLPDVDAMTPVEFERYLDRIRKQRSAYLPVKVKATSEKMTESWRSEEGDFTLINLATGRHSTPQDGANMQAGLIHEDIISKDSKILHSSPHSIGGLYYGSPTTTSTATSQNQPYIDPRTAYPGRALNKKDQKQHRLDKIVYGRNANSENNRPFVVSIGGLTGTVRPFGSTSDDVSLSETDYTRTNPERGIGRFQIKSALIRSLPTIMNLNARNVTNKFVYSSSRSGKKATPLDTFHFDIDLGLASASTRGTGKRDLVPGSRDWVGREQRRQFSREDDLGRAGPGGPRRDRVKGSALSDLRAAEQRSAEKAAVSYQQNSIDGLKAKLGI